MAALRAGASAGAAILLWSVASFAAPASADDHADADAPQASAQESTSGSELAPLPSPSVAFAGEKPAPQEPHEHFSLGVFGAASFPRPFSVGGMAKIERIAGFGAEYSALPKVSIGGAETSFWAVAGTARVFPFRGAFFLGIAGGRQHVALTAPTPLGVAAQTGDTWFVDPQIGFLKAFKWGFTIGIDAGVQIPVSATYASNVPQAVTNLSSVFNVAQTVTKSALPTVDLLRLGMTL